VLSHVALLVLVGPGRQQLLAAVDVPPHGRELERRVASGVALVDPPDHVLEVFLHHLLDVREVALRSMVTDRLGLRQLLLRRHPEHPLGAAAGTHAPAASCAAVVPSDEELPSDLIDCH
jgi:hypothetical protein